MTGLAADVLNVGDANSEHLNLLMSAYGIQIVRLPDNADIAGSFWGAPEAGIVGTQVLVRDDTPLHSMLHESSHIVCMAPELRDSHCGNAGSSDLEEAAVCYLQILLADELPGVGRGRLMADMDAWGYSFRLGNTAAWFAFDAADARGWLAEHGIIGDLDELTFRMR
jgi:hypothetical protein